MRYRLDVVAPTVLDAVKFAGGWIYDRVMAGWDVTVLIGNDEDVRPLQILGADTLDLESVLASWEHPPPSTDRCGRGRTVRSRSAGAPHVLNALDQGATEVTLWGERLPAELDHSVDSVAAPIECRGKGFQGPGARGGQRSGGGLRRPHRDIPLRDDGLGRRGPDPGELTPGQPN